MSARTPAASAPASTDAACRPQIEGIWAARAAPGSSPDAAAPDTGWEPVTLPDVWGTRWPGFDGIVWYRIDWRRRCEDSAAPLAVAFDAINMAGAVYLNDVLLWRDKRLVEPLSRGWNTPRLFFLPATALQSEHNRFEVQVAGGSEHGSGLGRIVLGPAAVAAEFFDQQQLFRRVLPGVNLVISGTLACFFLVVWLMRRQEVAYGWFALSSLFWLLFASNAVVTTPWPFSTTEGWSRWITVTLILYVTTFCQFLWRFGGQRFPRLSGVLWAIAAIAVVAVAALPYPAWTVATLLVLISYTLLFVVACLQFIARAVQTRQPEHLSLAFCALGFVVASMHDALLVLGVLKSEYSYTSISSPLIMVGMSLILAGVFTRSLRRVESFNDELETQVQLARDDLSHTLRHGHQLELDNVRLNVRLRIAHDLHDSLGSSLVRSIALLEHSDAVLERRQYLSILKSLRDDLRQVIDTNSSASAPVPDTPGQWIAPIRHRFGRLFEQMSVRCQWSTPEAWPSTLAPRQILGLTRFLEEALTNVVKHSQATTLRVRLEADDDQGACLLIEDDCCGFDVELVTHSSCGLGLRSMRARIERLGGALEMTSSERGTRLTARLQAPE